LATPPFCTRQTKETHAEQEHRRRFGNRATRMHCRFAVIQPYTVDNEFRRAAEGIQQGLIVQPSGLDSNGNERPLASGSRLGALKAIIVAADAEPYDLLKEITLFYEAIYIIGAHP